MDATLTFPTRQMAEAFAKAFTRKTLNGHTISSGTVNVTVIAHNLDDDSKTWIDDYVAKINSH